MAYDEYLADRIRKLLKGRPSFSEKKMFGGVGFLLNGNMCCGVLQWDLILRLGPEQSEEAFKDPEVRPFDFTGRAMTGWVMVGPDGYERHEALDRWVGLAAEFASTLAPKSHETHQFSLDTLR